MLLPYFALRRKWKFLALTCLFVAALNLAPAAYFGFGKNIELLKAWFSHVVVDQEFHEANGPINLSLKGQIARYVTDIDYSRRVDGDIGYPAINLLSIPSGKAEKLWMALAALSLLSGFLIVRHRSHKEGDGPLGEGARLIRKDRERALKVMSLEMALMISLMLMVGPLTSKIYFIALLWPAVIVSGFAIDREDGTGRVARGALIAAALTNSVLPLLPGRSVQRLLLVLGVDFYVNLLLAIMASLLLIAFRRIPEGQGAERRTEAL